MYTVWMEWDLWPKDILIFSSSDKASEWITATILNDESLVQEFPNGFDDAKKLGACGIIEAVVDPIC